MELTEKMVDASFDKLRSLGDRSSYIRDLQTQIPAK